MRILMLVKNFDQGGAQCHVRELANALADRGHRIWVVAPRGRQGPLLHRSVTHVPMLYSDLLHPWQAVGIARLVRKEGIDLLHAHQRLPTLMAILAGRLAARPVIATLHGQLQHDLTRWPAAPTLLDRLIVVSPFFLDLVARHAPVLAPKTVYIPNGVRRAPEAAPQADGGQRVVFAGRLVPRLERFVADLVRAAGDLAGRFPRLTLHIAGDGPSLPALETIARDVSLAVGRPVVRMLGFQADLPATVAGAALAIGVGRVALEALVQGVPVLTANQRYLGPMVSAERFATLAGTNFVPQHCPAPDRDGLGRALEGALSELDRWTNEARALQPAVAEAYALDVVAGATEREYEMLVQSAAISAGRARGPVTLGAPMPQNG